MRSGFNGVSCLDPKRLFEFSDERQARGMLTFALTAVLGLLLPALLAAQTSQYVISTIAGGVPPKTPVAALSASIGVPLGVALDSAGNVYFTSMNCVFKVDQNGVLTRIAGTSQAGFSGDGGPAVNAQFYLQSSTSFLASPQTTTPAGLAVDSSNNIYVADALNARVRKIGADGVVTTVLTSAFSVNAVAVDSAGNVYVAAGGPGFYGIVQKISTNGMVTTVAGTGVPGYSGDGGPAANAQLNWPTGIAVDASGNMYIADCVNQRVRKVSTSGIITTVAGGGTLSSLFPIAVAIKGSDSLWILDYLQGITQLSPAGTLSPFFGPQGLGLTVDASGSLYVASSGAEAYVSKISPAGVSTAIAGNGVVSYSGDGAQASSAELNNPTSVTTDTAGNIYIADAGNDRIRRIAGDGSITAVAGNGRMAFGGDNGTAISASLYSAVAVAVDHSGNMYIADYSGSMVRKVAGGTITTIAGGHAPGYSGDNGPATAAQFNGPVALTTDTEGNIYIADLKNNCIRKVSNGTVTTVAGTGEAGFSGDNGKATNAQLNQPYGIAVDAKGNLYIADTLNLRVRKVSPDGIITTISGTGVNNDTGDGGPASAALLSFPIGLTVDGDGHLYITTTRHVREILTDGTITTVAGTNGFSTNFAYTGDGGPALGAQLSSPAGIAVDSAGNIYIADSGHNAIRRVHTSTRPSIVQHGIISAGGFGGLAAAAPGGWVEIYGVNLAGSTGVWSAADFNGNNAPTALGGVSVTIGGQPAIIDFVSPGQVNAQIPTGIPVGGPLSVVLSYGNQSSDPYSLSVVPLEPGLLAPASFSVGGKQYVVALHPADNTFVGNGRIPGISSTPAKPGETIILYGIGFGPVDNSVPLAGQIVTQQNIVSSPVQVLFESSSAQVGYAGLAPGFIGLYQFNVVVPSVPNSGDVALTMTVGQSKVNQTLFISVSN